MCQSVEVRLRSTAIAAAVLPALAGCGGSGDAPTTASGSNGQNAVEITLKNIAFSPASASVKVGRTVRWTNQEDVDHNVIADSGASFRSKNFGKDGTFEFTPRKAGTVRYECTLHTGMKGVLTVR
jgi:plastocyanin